MEDRDKPSWAIRVLGPFIFILGSTAALLWFFYRLFYLFKVPLPEVVVLDKGSFYMLGVGVGMLVLAIVTVQEGWLGKPLSNTQSKYLTRMAYIGIALIFTTPHLVHYLADDYLVKSGYSVCEKASHQWLFVRDIVYIQETTECSEALKNKKY
jgi:hypothetical protein